MASIAVNNSAVSTDDEAPKAGIRMGSTGRLIGTHGPTNCAGGQSTARAAVASQRQAPVIDKQDRKIK
jgi:hypothetical protein